MSFPKSTLLVLLLFILSPASTFRTDSDLDFDFFSNAFRRSLFSPFKANINHRNVNDRFKQVEENNFADYGGPKKLVCLPLVVSEGHGH